MKKILVIEDNFEVRDNLVEILELSGYDVADAENGKVGVRKAKEFKPDLILCDVMMPELDGFGTLRILESQPETADIPFIFLTAKAEKQDFRKGMNLGADDYITKPFDDVELLDAIEMRLKKSKGKTATIPEGKLLKEGKFQEDINQLVEGKECRTFAKKTNIFEEGSLPRYVYYIKKGSIKIYKTNDYGKELVVRILSDGDFFGFESVINNISFADNAATLTESEVYLIPKQDFLGLMQNSREVMAEFNKLLASQVNEQDQKMMQFAYDSTRKKVANALLYFFKNKQEDSLEINREDLAAAAGVAKESAIRTLTDFKKEGIVRIEKNKISISDLNELEDLPY